MKSFLFKLNAVAKNILILIQPHVLLSFLIQPFAFISNFISLTKWIAQQPKEGVYKEAFSLLRNYNHRIDLYNYVINREQLQNAEIIYIEMGVCSGGSFQWWMENNQYAQSQFHGFDTFEGLPESWGYFFKNGDMHAAVPELADARGHFYKGLFQETLVPFLSKGTISLGKRKIIHLDADLFSSTLFSLSMLYPYLEKGDIIFFDEFNVPNHEYLAFKIFTESFYVNLELIGSVNNYYQAAFIVK
jgi:O-methyltransferase